MPTRVNLDEDDFRNILNGMVDGVITINDKGIILSFNKSAETIFGYKNEEVIGQNVSLLMPEPDSGQHDAYLNRYVKTEDAHIIGIGRDVVAQRKNGAHFPMRLSVIEYPSKVEGERWFIGSCLDITLYKQQEEQLRRSMKMEALGNLVGGVAHDYNNMLGVILGYSDVITERYKDDSSLLEYVAQIKRAGERSRDLTNSLLAFSRAQPVSKEIISINDVLNDNYQMLSKTLTAHIKLNLKLADDLWPVCLNRGCLEDVILNMSINAMHAMPEGGKLEFSTSNIQIFSLDSQILNIDLGDYIKLSISDTGIGMTKEVVSQIFDPFYTTKDEKGTGLGLSQVYGFVDKSAGTIKVYSEPGKGSCFSIYLPRYNKESNSIDSVEQEQSLEQSLEQRKYNGSGKILVVDDEIELRGVIETMLVRHGYDVISVAGGKQALLILEKEKVDLVISDVIMQGMDGYELAHIIHHKYPDIKIQLCSGFTDVQGKTVMDKVLSENILHKPFTSSNLLQSVKQALRD